MELTFLGFNSAVRGMSAAQAALDTVGNNISNANTEGYSRQQVNLVGSPSFTYFSANTPIGPAQISGGVDIAGIQRQRDGFLDSKIRNETSTLGNNEVIRDGVTQIEGQFNEPSDNGLAAVMTQYFSSWDQLSVNPESAAARSQVRQAGTTLANTFNSLYQGLTLMRTETDGKIVRAVSDINTYTSQIANLNSLIAQSQGLGLKSNDLQDQRDLALQKLSKIINVQQQISSDGRMLVTMQGRSLVGPNGAQSMATQPSAMESNVSDVTFNGQVVPITAMGGQLNAYFQVRDQIIGRPIYGTIGSPGPAGVTAGQWDTPNGILYQLDTMADTLSKQVNTLHAAGTNLSGGTGNNFFTNVPGSNPITPTTIGAQNISVNQVLLGTAGLNNIAAGRPSVAPFPITKPGPGDNYTSQQISSVRSAPVPGSNATINDIYRNFLSGLGVTGQTADRVAKNQTILIDHLKTQQEAVSGVNLDQEMSDMVRYQHAYNASAKVVSMFDQLLDTIINLKR